MITGGKITYVEARRDSEEPIKGLSLNISLDDVKVKAKEVEIVYTYTATYAEGVGELKIKGSLKAEEDKATAKAIAEQWEKEKRLPEEFAELVLNTINFTCGTNGTLVVRPVNLSPPMIPPKIQLSKGEARGSSQ